MKFTTLYIGNTRYLRSFKLCRVDARPFVNWNLSCFQRKKLKMLYIILFDNLLKKSYMASLVLVSSIYTQTSSTRKKSRFTQRNSVSCIISDKTKYMKSFKRKTDTIRYDIIIFNIMYSLEIPLSIYIFI